MAGVKMIKLASGSMPQLGFGTWRSEPGKVKKAVEVAIAAGYRHIDAAWIYGNEAEVGAGIASSLKQHNLAREDLWVTSKLWSKYTTSYIDLENTMIDLDRQLSRSEERSGSV